MKTQIIPNGTIVRFHISGRWHYGVVKGHCDDPDYHPDHYDVRDVSAKGNGNWMIPSNDIQTLQSILKDRQHKPWDYQYDCTHCPGNHTIDDGWHKFGCSIGVKGTHYVQR